MRQEYVLCAAIWVDDGIAHVHQPVPTGIVYCGHRHHTIFVQDPRTAHGKQGFLISNGKFADREEALKIAINAGQIKETGRTELYSEDLY